MFIPKKVNASGSTSVQVISKARGYYKVLKTVGCATIQCEIDKLVLLAKQEIDTSGKQLGMYTSDKDVAIEEAFAYISIADTRTFGPEFVFGRIYDGIDFNQVEEILFRYLVIARRAFPLSKLKTVEYLYRYQGTKMNIDAVYRFLDKLNDKLKPQVEQIAYAHTLKVLHGNISIVFYDMTTLYFEASDEDDLRKLGFNKDGKHQNPQIYIGLLIGMGGYAIWYDIFEGNIYKRHTLILFIEKISLKYNLDKSIVVADAGLLSNDNIRALEKMGYEYINRGTIKK